MTDEGPARIAGLDSDFNLSGNDQPQNQQTQNKRSSYGNVLDTANDWWNVFRNVVQGVGWTAVQGASGAAAYYSGILADYAKFANDVYDAYRRGKATYDDLQRAREDYKRAKDWLDENIPRDVPETPDVDNKVPEQYEYGDRIARGSGNRWAELPVPDYGDRTARGSGNRSGELPVPRARGSSRRKHNFAVSYEYD